MTNFKYVITHFSDFVRPTASGLMVEELHLLLDTISTPNTLLKINVELMLKEYEEEKRYSLIKSQSVYQFNRGIKTNEDEIYLVTKDAIDRLLNYQATLEDGHKQSIKTLYPRASYPLQENIRQMLVDTAAYISSL